MIIPCSSVPTSQRLPTCIIIPLHETGWQVAVEMECIVGVGKDPAAGIEVVVKVCSVVEWADGVGQVVVKVCLVVEWADGVGEVVVKVCAVSVRKEDTVAVSQQMMVAQVGDVGEKTPEVVVDQEVVQLVAAGVDQEVEQLAHHPKSVEQKKKT